jgi:hypothetical protein
MTRSFPSIAGPMSGSLNEILVASSTSYWCCPSACLPFGFWRYLNSAAREKTLWVSCPALPVLSRPRLQRHRRPDDTCLVATCGIHRRCCYTFPMAVTRDDVHQLVDAVPEEALPEVEDYLRSYTRPAGHSPSGWPRRACSKSPDRLPPRHRIRNGSRPRGGTPGAVSHSRSS